EGRLPGARASRRLLARARLPDEAPAAAFQCEPRGGGCCSCGQAGRRERNRERRTFHRRARDRPGRRGVRAMTFASPWFLLVILTTDRTVLHEGIDLLSPEAGTAIGDGLELAVQTVKVAVGDAPRGKDGKVPGAIVLLSDGAQTRGVLTPLQGAGKARDAGIRVFTIALGTDHGTLNGFGFGFGG